MQHVFVLSTDKQPLDPCHPARARQLLRAGKAAVWRRFPFTIILKGRTAAESATHPHTIKLDPGSKTTGLAVVNDRRQVVWGAELTHKGSQVAERLRDRHALRRSRRQRHTRYTCPHRKCGSPGAVRQPPPARRLAHAQYAVAGRQHDHLGRPAAPPVPSC